MNKNTFWNYLPKILLCACCLALLFALIVFAFNVRHTSVHYKIDYGFVVDSAGAVSPQSRAAADSIIHAIERHERLLEDKYQYVINQQSNAQDLLAIGGVVLGIIVSIVGFFGYTTLQSIEEKARTSAKDAADSAFKQRVKELQEQELNRQIKDVVSPSVDKQILDAVNKYWGKHGNLIEGLDKDVRLLKNAVSNIDKKISGSANQNHEAAPNPAADVRKEPNAFE